MIVRPFIQGIDLMQQAKEIRTRFEAQLAVANSEKEEARAETETLRDDLNRLRGDLSVQVSWPHVPVLRWSACAQWLSTHGIVVWCHNQTQEAENAKQEYLAKIAEFQGREKEWNAQLMKSTEELRNSHKDVTAKLQEQVKTLQEQHEDDRRAIAELSASLQDTERNRETTIKHLAQLEESLIKVRTSFASLNHLYSRWCRC